jgi:hypothetical protein
MVVLLFVMNSIKMLWCQFLCDSRKKMLHFSVFIFFWPFWIIESSSLSLILVKLWNFNYRSFVCHVIYDCLFFPSFIRSTWLRVRAGLVGWPQHNPVFVKINVLLGWDAGVSSGNHLCRRDIVFVWCCESRFIREN